VDQQPWKSWYHPLTNPKTPFSNECSEQLVIPVRFHAQLSKCANSCSSSSLIFGSSSPFLPASAFLI
jgi:hypothetical protein